MILPGLPGISGMVKVAANQYLVIHDAKGPRGARLGIIYVQADGAWYQEIGIPNWPSNEPLPNDLEGICAIPNRPGEYLIVESGFYLGHFGRVIKIGYEEGAPLSATYLGSFQPLPPPPKDASTPKPKQIEGIAVVAHEEGMTVLLLGLRGGKEKPDDPEDDVVPGQLIWGALTDIDTPNPKFTQSGTATLSYKPIADRGAVDLYVLSKTSNSWDIYSVATSDPGDLGPFRSAVYSAGTLTINRTKISFLSRKTKKIVHWDFDGLKVEAIAAPAEIFKETSGLSIATDDELYNSVWRPISNSTATRSPSQLLFVKTARAGFALK
jgi:hypothetical protein